MKGETAFSLSSSLSFINSSPPSHHPDNLSRHPNNLPPHPSNRFHNNRGRHYCSTHSHATQRTAHTGRDTAAAAQGRHARTARLRHTSQHQATSNPLEPTTRHLADRKSTRLNSRHANISYAVSCL